jgi:phage terminase large subunit
MEIKLNKWQTQVWEDAHRFRVVCAGRRSGKSVLSQLTVIYWANQNKGDYYIVAPTYRQAKEIHWRGIQQYIPQVLISAKNETELSITLKNGSRISLKGAENPDALRGIKLRGLIIDEIASIRNWDWLWSEVLRPTLTDYEAPALFISTPKGFNHFYELFNLGTHNNDLYKSFHFTSYENIYIPKQELDHAKEELTEDTFAQEYMADFRKYTGLVYKEFDRQVHVIEPFNIPQGWSIYRGLDFGSTNPTACLWFAVDGDSNWFIIDEYYETGQTIDYHSGIINARQFSKSTVQSFGDPSGAQWIQEFAERGIYITPANKEVGTSFNSWVRFGIEKVAERLRIIPGHTTSVKRSNRSSIGSGEPKLYVFNSCENTIKEFENYRWQEKKVTQAQDLNELDAPEKANDHAMDALRYFAVSYRAQSKTDKQRYGDDYEFINKQDKLWRIGR